MDIDANSPRQQNPNRNAIDICDHTFKARQEPLKLGDSLDTEDLEQQPRGIKWFRYLISMTVLHELTHTWPFGVADIGGESAYGWSDIVKKQTRDSLNNADNYAYLALWAAMAVKPSVQDGRARQGGYTLPRDSEYPGLSRSDENARDRATKRKRADVVAGRLRWYDDLSKRSLSLFGRVVKAFVA
ncbi:MAG: hypothetical protein Q9160_008621 [Pyrenula sp. 1 TL-2023]